jgi:hypothetical protein
VLTALAGGTLKGTLHPYFIVLGKFEQPVRLPERDWMMRSNVLSCLLSAIASHMRQCY